MNILVQLHKLRLWGIKGAINYLKKIVLEKRKMRILQDNAERYPLKPAKGITLLADMTGRSSLSKVMRDLAFKMKQAGIPFQAYDLGTNGDIPSQDIEDLLTPLKEFHVLKYNCILEMFSSPLPPGLPLKRSRVVFWEFTTGLLEYDPAIGNVDTVIGMSDFDVDVFRNLLPKTTNVKKILYPFMFPPKDIPSSSDVRRRYGLSDDAFVVFFNFDYGSSFNRKNPDGAMRAFAKAFANIPKARLVFKTKRAKQHSDAHRRLKSLATELDIANQFISIDNFIPMSDIYGLTAACDVYLSLHRGEGFGLGIAEAMSLGKPVVVTDYSSTTEFCKPGNSIPVPYRIVAAPHELLDNPCYDAVKTWAEPDIDSAALSLRDLYDNPAKCSQLGCAAKQFITDYFSIENFKKSIESFLNS